MAQVVTNLLLNGLSGLTVGGSGTGTKYWPLQPGASIGVNSTKNGYLYIPGNGASNGQRLSVRATGNFQVGYGTACPNVTIGLYSVTFAGNVPSGTPTINATPVLISSSITAQTADQIAYPFSLVCDLAGDGTGTAGPGNIGDVVNTNGSGLVQTLSGAIVVDGVNTNATAGLTSGLTGINFSSSVPFALLMGITFSQSDSGNSATLFQFDLSQ